MSIFTKYIQNEEHYSEVISRIAKVRNTLWIGTADIKDVYVKQDGDAIPLLGQIAGLLKRGVGVRLIHANDPAIVEPAIEQFDTLWMGSHCKKCGRQEFCGDRIK